MQTPVRFRRLLACLGVSLLLHATAAIYRPSRRPPEPAADAEVSVSFEPSEPAHTRVAIVGERASGPGRALAGSNPRRRGSPWRAPRQQSPAGRAEGPGTTGAIAIADSAPSSPGPHDVASPAVPLADGDVAIPPPSVRIATTNDATSPPAAPPVDADRAFDALARAQLVSLANGDGGGLAGSGRGNGGVGFGLTTELSGQHRADSPVVSAPVVVGRQPVACELPSTLRLRAIVRVLVTRDGTGAVPRLLQSSGHPSFDRCALAYVLALHFSPGTDASGRPLDVWMNVQVAPSTTGQLEDVH